MPTKRKQTKKHRTASRQQSRHSGTFLLGRYIIISLAAIVALVAGKIVLSATSQVHVLGVKTGPVIIADSQDMQDATNQQDTQQPNHTDTQQPQTTPDQNQQNHPSQQGQPLQQQTETNQQTTDNTRVDCIGHDGTHFVTDFHTCQELNQKWGNQQFQFTPLNTQQTNLLQNGTTQEIHQIIKTPQATLEVQTEGNKGEINLQTPGTQIYIKKEDNGTIHLVAQTENGKQIILENDALTSINEALQEKDIHVGTGSATNQLIIQSGDTKAETTLPIALDPSTKTLAVTTPQGTKDLTVLPNQAVNTLLQQKILSSVLASATTTTASAGSSLNTTQLTEIDNQPAYAVQGVTDKNLFGIFPMAYTKTVYVSAQNGQVLHVQQPIFDQLLQLVSF